MFNSFILVNSDNKKWWRKGYGFTSDISEATVYDTYEKASAIAKRIKVDHALVVETEDILFNNGLFYNSGEDKNKYPIGFKYDFYGWEEAIHKATGNPAIMFDLESSLKNILKGLPHETTTLYYGVVKIMFTSKDDATEFVSRLNKKLWIF